MAKKEETAAEYGVKLLAISSRTEAQLARKMSEKGFSVDEVSKAVSYFRDRNFINDAEYAAKAVEKYTGTSFFSKEMIREKLAEKGVPPPVIEAALDGISDRATALEAVKAKFGAGKNSGNVLKLRQKAAIYLQTKGFDYDIIGEIIESEFKGGNELEQQ
jgi:regulatory protein